MLAVRSFAILEKKYNDGNKSDQSPGWPSRAGNHPRGPIGAQSNPVSTRLRVPQDTWSTSYVRLGENEGVEDQRAPKGEKGALEPSTMALPASSLPSMKEGRAQIILRRHSKCKKSDQGVTVVQARANRGHTFLV